MSIIYMKADNRERKEYSEFHSCFFFFFTFADLISEMTTKLVNKIK